MASTSSKSKKGSNMLVWGVEWKALDFKLILAITKTLDPTGAQNQIPLKVLLIKNIHLHFFCAIQDFGTLEMDESLKTLCVNVVLKPEHQHLEAKG